MAEQKGKIDNTTWFLMLTVAITVDAVQFIVGLLDFITIIGGTIINILIGLFVAMTFFMWFAIKGIMTMQSTLTLCACVTGRSIPFLDMLPTWTAAIIYTVGKEKVQTIAEKIPGGAVAGKAVSRAAKIASEM